MSGRPPATNLRLFQSYLFLNAFSERSKVVSISLDITKVSDRMSHALLFSKLEDYEFYDFPLTLRKDHWVRFGSALSREFTATLGVFPSAHIFYTIYVWFNIYMNDILIGPQCGLLFFADGLNFFLKVVYSGDSKMAEGVLWDLWSWMVDKQ